MFYMTEVAKKFVTDSRSIQDNTLLNNRHEMDKNKSEVACEGARVSGDTLLVPEN